MDAHEKNPSHDADTSRVLAWSDIEGGAWRVELVPHEVRLHNSAGVTLELPAATWSRDILASMHGDRIILRIETFDRGVAFLLSEAEARPFLEHTGLVAPAGRAARIVEADREDEPTPRRQLLWPKVSPLAVWALGCSALAFLPIVGFLAAAVTIILLILHRRRVRRVAALRHSRVMCVVAFVFMSMGLVVSVMATIGVRMTNDQQRQNDYRADELESSPASDAHPAPEITRASIAGMQGDMGSVTILAKAFWEGDHNWALIVAGLFVVLMSLSVHEAAHAITALWLGDDLARREGRVTLNPLAHIDPVGTVLLPLILFMAGGGVFGWARPVPVLVDHLPNRRRAHILISLAGPGSNLLLASASLMLLLAMGCLLRFTVPDAEVTNFVASFDDVCKASGFALAPVFGPVATILSLGFVINVFLACFNLIPIPPLDGSWVLEHLFPRTFEPIYERIRPFGILLFLGLIYTGVLRYLFVPVFSIIHAGGDLLAQATGIWS